jgi:hypothetical protein
MRKKVGGEVNQPANVYVDLLVRLRKDLVHLRARRVQVEREHDTRVVHEAVDVRVRREQLVHE